MPAEIKVINSLQWPSDIKKVNVECAGASFLEYTLIGQNKEFLLGRVKKVSDPNAQVSADEEISQDTPSKKKKKTKQINLFELNEVALKDLSFYDILQIPMAADSDAIKKAYHKACLKYHPDKSGRGEEDAVFLAVKSAFDTLSDGEKRRSYDSTVDFDESIPAGGESAKDFLKVYGPVFERNLRFAVREIPNEGKRGKKGGGGGGMVPNNDNPLEGIISCPPFGDDNTPIEQIQQFYEYWTHFNSWRDFTLKAQEMTKHDLDMADNRDEKRWMAKEVDRKSKNLKKQEVARIALLVERAMAADPRLKRHREQERLAKEKIRQDKEEKERELQQKQKQQEEQEAKEAAEREEKLKIEKAKEKVIQQKQKKELRKARQLLRRIMFKAFEEQAANDEGDDEPFWGSLEKMNDDVEFLCDRMTVEQITELSSKLGGERGEVPEQLPDDVMYIIEDSVQTLKGVSAQEKAIQKAKRDEARKRVAQREAEKKAIAAAANPWSKEELSTLAKAVKKYPAGGANRWETIAMFLNNALALAQPRTKEECIAQYNETMRTLAVAKDSPVATPKAAEDAWTPDEDAKLQEGLKEYPASMDKNERWSAISKLVGTKSKKDCVQRFKFIREALKNKK